MGRDRQRRVVRSVAEQIAVVHLGRAHDLARVEHTAWIEGILDFLERGDEPVAEHLAVEFRAHDAVAVLARMRAAVRSHERERFFRDRTQFAHVGVGFHVEHRAHVQAADRRVRVPGADRPMVREDGVELVRVFGEMLERDGAVFDDRDRLRIALHRGHDVEARGAHAPELRLIGRARQRHDAVREAERRHHPIELREPFHELERIVAREFHQQDRTGLAAHELLDRRPEDGARACQLQHRCIDELDRDGAQRDEFFRRRHRVVEARKMADAERRRARQRLQREFDLREERERSLGADEQLRRIEIVAQGEIEVVAADAPQHLGKASIDFCALAQRDRADALDERVRRRTVRIEPRARAVGEHRVDRAHVVDHVAVADRARARTIIGGHPADRRSIRGGRIDRKEEPVRLERRIELREHDPRLHAYRARLHVERDDLAQILRGVDDDRFADGLAALRGPTAAREHRHAFVRTDIHDRIDVAFAARDHDADRLDLIDRGVGRVQAARRAVETHLAADPRAQRGR